MMRLLVVNSGLLGAGTFGTRLLPGVAAHATDLQIEQVVLTDGLTLPERIFRRALCQRVWTDRWPALSNLDLARYRAEWHAGLMARKRLGRVDLEAFDVAMFYRPPAAYASLSVMRRIPSIVAIDCTQECMRASMASPVARATLGPGIRRDGRVFAAASVLLSNSRWAAGSLHRLYPRCHTPVEVLPPPVDLAPFDEAWIDARAARSAAGAPPRVLFIGGDFKRKGGFALLRAWREGGLGAQARLDLVTGWPLADRDLPPGVAVYREVEAYSARWRELWRTADVFAMPTRHEAFGMVFQEAAAAGLPRIGTRENAGPELVQDGVNGLLVEPGDVDGLVRALRTLLADAALRAAMGRASREFIVSTAAVPVYAAGLERVVRRAVALHQEGMRAA